MEKAGVEKFFIKTAEQDFYSAIGQGVGKGLGEAGVNALFAAGSGLAGMAFGNSQRKKVYELAISTDPLIMDAIKRRPDMAQVLEEAHKTMVRFAPTLAMDLNAVRSFLREAVLGGSGVNYATIKNLVETEASIAKAQPGMFGRR